MSEAIPEPVRSHLLQRSVMEVLAESEVPLKQAAVLAAVEARLSGQLTGHELELVGDSTYPRWANDLIWGSTGLRAAGWITKERAGWAITAAGRDALDQDTDGRYLLAESNRMYREIQREKKIGPQSGQPLHAQVLEAALELLEPGQWTTYGELAEVAGTNAQTVGNFTKSALVEGTHRVMGKDGRPVAGFVWADGRQGTQRQALEAEGVQFDANGVASEEQHVRAGDFRAYLEDRGILRVLPKRAWLVRGSSVDGHDLIPRWRGEGFVSLRAAKLREVAAGIGRDELKTIVNDDYSQTSYAAKAAKLDEFHAFLSRMQVGDVVATTSQGRLHLGEVIGEAEYQHSPDGLTNLRRSVAWMPGDVDYADLPGEVKARL